MLSKEELPACPVATCFQLFGNKWKIYVIQRLIERPYGFNELKRSIEGISQKVLSANLKEMESAGLISRTVIPDTPIRTEYALSEIGESLMPLISSMVAWGQNYQRIVNESD
jgi:DNA-binding HxlR family transcriptional regulator